MMLSCKEATRLVSEGLDRRLSFWRRMRLRLHVVMCRGCARYARQTAILDRIISDRDGEDLFADASEQISQKTVRQIRSSLHQAATDTNHPDGK